MEYETHFSFMHFPSKKSSCHGIWKIVITFFERCILSALFDVHPIELVYLSKCQLSFTISIRLLFTLCYIDVPYLFYIFPFQPQILQLNSQGQLVSGGQQLLLQALPQGQTIQIQGQGGQVQHVSSLDANN